jgi:PAS domain S-box-containing protein
MQKRTSWKTIVIPIAVFAAIVTAFFVYWRGSRRHERETLSLKTSLTAQQVAIRLEEYISIRLQAAASIRGNWTEHIDSYQTFKEHAENVVENLGGLLALNWIDSSGVIRWVVPEEPNLAAKGRDLMANPAAGPFLRQAKDTGETVVTRPLNLYQGGRGVAAYIPIVADGENKGFLNAVFRLQPMIEDCLARGVRENFFFLVREGDEQVYASADDASILADPTCVSDTFRVDDRLWTVTLSPSPSLAATATTTGPDLIFGLGLLLALVAGLLSWRVLDSRARLKRSEARFRQIIDTAQEGIWTIDADANTSFVNDRMAAMLGYDATEMLGHPVDAFMDEGDRGETGEDAARRPGGFADVDEYPLRRKDGSRLWTSMSTNPLYDNRGRYAGALAMVSDITERKRAEQERRDFEAQIRQAQKLESLGVLAGGIAHDFNNLLTGIIGNVGVALEELNGAKNLQGVVEEIDSAARRAAGLCQLMLTYSGRGQIEMTPVDLNELIEEMGNLLAVSISKKAVVEYELAEALPSVDADSTQIGQILMNLITNASEALGDESGMIVVRTDTVQCDENYLRDTYLSPDLPAGDYVYLEVRDTGVGMNAETLDKIFDPFFTTKFVGRGLGLAAVLGIIRSHRGAIKVDSAPGLGTTIRVLLPAGRTAKPGARHDVKPRRGVSAVVRGRTVLAVDDEEIVLSLIKRVLEAAGATVLTADNGHEAIARYRGRPDDIDCVVLDLTMPEMDGEETFRALREIRGDVRVVISSGYAEEEVSKRFEGQDVAQFISKPFLPAELLCAVSRVLAGT